MVTGVASGRGTAAHHQLPPGGRSPGRGQLGFRRVATAGHHRGADRADRPTLGGDHGPSPSHIPATVGFILLAAACAAGLAAVRFLKRRRPWPPSPPAPTVNTVPHAGPPGAVTVQPSRTEATHSLRIEPHPAAAVTTIEESRP